VATGQGGSTIATSSNGTTWKGLSFGAAMYGVASGAATATTTGTTTTTAPATVPHVSIFTLNQFVWIIVGGVFLLTLIVGLSVPCCACSRATDARWRNSVIILYAFAWVLPGLDVGSIVLSWHSHRKDSPEWCIPSCGPCSSSLGVLEFILVVFAFPVAAVLDCVLLPYFAAPGVVNSSVPFFLLLVAIPGYFGGLLLFGLPRAIIGYNATQKQSQRAHVLDIVASAAIPLDHTCNGCRSTISTKFCGNCGADNKCNHCNVFVVGHFCQQCGLPLATRSMNPYAQQQSPPLPLTKPVLPPKPRVRKPQSTAFFSFLPKSMASWILCLLMAAVSVVVLGLCADQLFFAYAFNWSYQAYQAPPPNGYGVNGGAQWYASTCIGKCSVAVIFVFFFLF
jgi:hypothetical protein